MTAQDLYTIAHQASEQADQCRTFARQHPERAAALHKQAAEYERTARQYTQRAQTASRDQQLKG